MKLIMENWRKYLSEGMKTVDDLPDGIVITVDTDPKPGDGDGAWTQFGGQLPQRPDAEGRPHFRAQRPDHQRVG